MAGLFAPLALLDFIRAIAALLLFGLAPGYLLLLAHRRERDWLAPLKKDAFEAVGLAAIASFSALALLSSLLVFTIGFGFWGILVLEAALLVGGFLLWKRMAA